MIKIRIHLFTEDELSGNNPYNDELGYPMPGFLGRSYAWAEAAYKFRISLKNNLS